MANKTEKAEQPAEATTVDTTMDTPRVLVASGKRCPDRQGIASRLLGSIIQLPVYTDIVNGTSDDALMDGAVTLSLMLTDKLIAQEECSRVGR